MDTLHNISQEEVEILWYFSWWAKKHWSFWINGQVSEPLGLRPTESAALMNIKLQTYYADKLRRLHREPYFT